MNNDQFKNSQQAQGKDKDNEEFNESQYLTFLRSLIDETLISHINNITQSQGQNDLSFQEASTPKRPAPLLSSASTDPFNDGLDEDVIKLVGHQQGHTDGAIDVGNQIADDSAPAPRDYAGDGDDGDSSESEKDESVIGKLHEFGDYRTYFESKRMKQQVQDEAYVKWDRERRKLQNQNLQPLLIFAGCTIFVNGHTKPSINEIHRLVILHGGKFLSYLLNKSSATHIVCDRLTPRKNVMFKNCRVVKAQWIVDCVEAGRILDWQQYRLILDIAFDQKRLDFQPGQSKETGANVEEQSVPKETSPPVDEAEDEAELEGMGEEDDFESTLLPEEENLLQRLQHAEANAAEQGLIEENIDDDIPKFDVAPPSNSTKGVHKIKGKYVLDARHPDFLAGFFANSRLHHLSMWKADLRLKFLRKIIKKNLHKPVEDPFREGAFKSKVIMHIDFDCFFATASCLKHPNLDINKDPIAVGHGGNTSDVASCNYVARKFGVRNGMWLRLAQKLCPNLISLDYEFEAYERYSSEFYNYLVSSNYFDSIYPVSIDEVLVDATSYCNKSENGVENAANELASLIRKHVYQLTNCTVSVGLGPNVLLAKLALRKAKPHGQFALFGDAGDFLRSVPVRDLPGFGSGILEKLEPEVGKSSPNIEDMMPISNSRLIQLLGEKTGTKLYQYARGIDHTSIEIDTAAPEIVLGRKSISVDVNFGIRFDTMEELDDFFMRLARELYQRMINLGVCGSTLTLKLAKRRAGASVVTAKFLGLGEVDFVNKSSRLGVPTNDWGVIGSEVKVLYRMLNIPVKDLRGISVSMTKLKDAESVKSSKQMKLPFGAVGKAPPANEDLDPFRSPKEVHSSTKRSSFNKGSVSFAKLSSNQRRDKTPSAALLDPFANGQQIDWEVFESLPLEIRRELQNELQRRGFLKKKSPFKGKTYLQELIPTQSGTAKYVRVGKSPTKTPPKRKSTPIPSPVKKSKSEPLYDDSQSYDSSLLNQLPSSVKADVLKDMEYKQKIKKFDLVPMRDKVNRKIEGAKVEIKEITAQWVQQQPKLFDMPLFLNEQVTASELRQKVKDWVNTSLDQGGPHEDDVLYFGTYLQLLLDRGLFTKAVMLVRDILGILMYRKTVFNCFDEDDDDNQHMFLRIGFDDWYKQIDAVLKPVVANYCKVKNMVLKW